MYPSVKESRVELAPTEGEESRVELAPTEGEESRVELAPTEEGNILELRKENI